MTIDLTVERCSACGAPLSDHRRADGRQIACRGSVVLSVSSPWMTAEVCAAYLGLSLDSLYQAIRRRGLPASRMGGGRQLRFNKTYVDQWVESGVDPRATRHLQLAKAAR